MPPSPKDGCATFIDLWSGLTRAQITLLHMAATAPEAELAGCHELAFGFEGWARLLETACTPNATSTTRATDDEPRRQSWALALPLVSTVNNFADFFTKQLHAKAFFSLRDKIMNHSG